MSEQIKVLLILLTVLEPISQICRRRANEIFPTLSTLSTAEGFFLQLHLLLKNPFNRNALHTTIMPSKTKAILPAAPKEGDKGQLTATILSAYDLPSPDSGAVLQPTFVSMTLLGKEVRTGPPSARHRDRNSFKFVSEKDSSKNAASGKPSLCIIQHRQKKHSFWSSVCSVFCSG